MKAHRWFNLNRNEFWLIFFLIQRRSITMNSRHLATVSKVATTLEVQIDRIGQEVFGNCLGRMHHLLSMNSTQNKTTIRFIRQAHRSQLAPVTLACRSPKGVVLLHAIFFLLILQTYMTQVCFSGGVKLYNRKSTGNVPQVAITSLQFECFYHWIEIGIFPYPNSSY